MTRTSNPNELKITRIYDAPVEAVWDAWTDPKQAAHWWGPRGFTITTHSKDLRPGGIWHYTMHGPDGVDYPNKTKYYEVVKHSRLVYDHGGNDERAPMFRVEVKFSEMDGRTKLEMTMTLPTPEAAEKTRKFVRQAGGNATWDRLAEYLEKQSTGREQFVITRTFDAPISTLFDMWTDPKHFSQWLPPTGFTMEFLSVSIKTGGSSFYRMSNGAGVTMYGRADYHEITKPNRIVYTQQFCDEKGGISRHPMAPVWPETMLTTVTLSEDGPDKTRIKVVWEAHGKTTEAELAAFLSARGGMTQGWTGSFDKLEGYLQTQRTTH